MKTILKASAAIYLAVGVAGWVMPAANAQEVAGRQTAATTTFNIRAQALGSALTAFADRAGLRLLLASSVVDGKRSAGVSGMLTRDEALNRLLQGTGLSYRFTSANTVTIVDLTATANAGSIATDSSTTLDTIVVQGQNDGTTGIVATRSSTGTKNDTPILEVPQTVNVVTRKEMDDRGVTDFNAAVAYTPGIRAIDYPGGQGAPDIYLRGFRAFDLFGLYKDGLRLGPNQYDTDIEQYAYESIDVLKGPASTLFGQSAPGGLVNMTTKRPTETPIHEIQTQLGSFDRKQIAIDMGGPVTDDGPLLYRFTGLWRDSGTQIDHSPDDRLYLAPSLTWKPDESTSLTILSSYQKTKKGGAEQSLPMDNTIFDNGREIPSSFLLGVPGVSRWNTENVSAGYEFKHEFDNGWAINSKFRYTYADVDFMVGSIRGAKQLWDDQYLRIGMQHRPRSSHTFLLDNNIAGEFDTGPLEHSVVVGLDYTYFRQKTFRQNTSNYLIVDILDPTYDLSTLTWADPWENEKSTQHQLGIYLQDQIKFDKWILSLNGRYDRVETKSHDLIEDAYQEADDGAFTGRIGLGYLFDNGVAPYVSYSTSFQADLNTDYYGNMFEPTTGEQWEAGIKYQPLGWNGFITASIFEITQQNVTTNDPIHTGHLIQQGEVRSRGFELEGKVSLTDNLDLIAGYSYTDARVTKANDNVYGYSEVGTRKASVPYHQASLWVDYQFPQDALLGLKVGGGVRYVGSSMAVMESTTGNQVKVPGYTLFDASIAYDFGTKNPDLKGLSLIVAGTNLTDEKYFTPGFYSNTVFYGNRRTVNATLSYKW